MPHLAVVDKDVFTTVRIIRNQIRGQRTEYYEPTITADRAICGSSKIVGLRAVVRDAHQFRGMILPIIHIDVVIGVSVAGAEVGCGRVIDDKTAVATDGGTVARAIARGRSIGSHADHLDLMRLAIVNINLE